MSRRRPKFRYVAHPDAVNAEGSVETGVRLHCLRCSSKRFLPLGATETDLDVDHAPPWLEYHPDRLSYLEAFAMQHRGCSQLSTPERV